MFRAVNALATLAAVQSPAWEPLRSVSRQTWINLILCVAAVIVIGRIWRALKSVNEFVPYIVAVLMGGLIFFYWVYERSEPRFLTPLVDQLAPFFPSKSKQQQIQDKRRQGRDV